MPGEKATLNLEELQKKDDLSSTDQEALEAEVLKDREAEEKTPEDLEKEAQEKNDAEIQAKADLDNRAEAVGLEAGSSVEKIEEAEKAKAGSVEDTPKEPSEEEKPKKEEEKKQEDIVALYAKENNMSAEEAQLELESINKVADKYGKDATKLAKANLYLQRSFNDSQEKLKKLEAAPPAKPIPELNIDNVIKVIDEGTLKDAKGNVMTRDSVIAYAREEDPATYEDMEDEKVLRVAAKDLVGFIKEAQKKNLAKFAEKLQTESKEKREKLLAELPEEVKSFLPDIKAILEKASDKNVMNPDFDMSVYVAYAKGLHYDEDLKKAKETALKQGKEEAEIVGEKIPGGGGGSPTPKGSSKKITDLQKQRALEMYEGSDITEKQKFEWFLDYLKDNPEADPELGKKK